MYDISGDRKSRSGESLEPFFTGHWEVETMLGAFYRRHHRGTSLDEDLAKEFFYLHYIIEMTSESLFPWWVNSLNLIERREALKE